MSGSLKSKSIQALSWSLAHEVFQRALQLGISIFLARLLSPVEFGLIAMLTVFLAVSAALLDSGFGSALVQKRDLNEVDKASVFYLNVCFSVLLVCALYLASPWIADFYDQPQLTSLTRVLSLLLLINSFSLVPKALALRNLDCKRQALFGMASTAISGAVGIPMAWYGYGVWSIVAQQLTAAVVRAGLYWIMGDWRPGFMFRFGALKDMFGFGSRLAASSVLHQFFENLYPLIIGKLFSASTLGYFNRAQTLQAIPAQSLGMVMGRVMLPLFSRLQNDLPRLRQALRKATVSTFFLQVPMMVGLALVAQPLVLLLLTAKWAPAIPYLQLLCFAGLWYPLQLLNLNALLAIGRSDLFFKLEVIKKATIVLSLFITCQWGVTAMIIGHVLTSIGAYYANSFYTGRLIGYSTWQQLRDIAPYFVAAGCMAAVVGFMPFSGERPAVQLIVKITVGAATYVGLSLVFRFPAMTQIREIISQRFNRQGIVGCTNTSPMGR